MDIDRNNSDFASSSSSDVPDPIDVEDISSIPTVHPIESICRGSALSEWRGGIALALRSTMESCPGEDCDKGFQPILVSLKCLLVPLQDVEQSLLSIEEKLQFITLLPKKAGSKCRCDAQWYASNGVLNIAFGCKTCGLSSASCICVACFEAGDHEGHEFYVSKSDYGCCDCGDLFAWRKSGFCNNHTGPVEGDKPEDRLDRWTREAATEVVGAIVDILVSEYGEMCFVLFNFLRELCALHDGLRRLVGETVIESGLVDRVLPASHLQSQGLRKAWTNLMVDLMLDLEFKSKFAVVFSRHYQTMVLARLGELETMIGNESSGHRHSSGPTGRLTNDVGDLTCQIFTRPDVISNLVQSHGLLETLMDTASEILERATVRVDLERIDSGPMHKLEDLDRLADTPALTRSQEEYLAGIIQGLLRGEIAEVQVVDPEDEASDVEETFAEEMSGRSDAVEPHTIARFLDHSHFSIERDFAFQSLMDLTYAIDHPAVANMIVSDESLFSTFIDKWLLLASQIQYMNPHKRRFDLHVEFFDGSWPNPLVLQSDVFMTFWLVRVALQKGREKWEFLAQKVFLKLNRWTSTFAINSGNTLSLHCPLNRAFSLALTELIVASDREDSAAKILRDFFPSLDTLLHAIELPVLSRKLQTQVALGLWTRNGEALSRECEHYRAALFHHHLLSPDLELGRVALMAVANWEVSTVSNFANFFNKLHSLFEIHLSQEHVNSLLLFLVELLTVQHSSLSDQSEEELFAQRVTSLLVLQERTYSQLRDPFSERWTSTLMPRHNAVLDRAVEAVAEPIGGSPPTYKLKDQFWLSADLVSPFWQLREFQKGEERLRDQLKRVGGVKRMGLQDWWESYRSKQPQVLPQCRELWGRACAGAQPYILNILSDALTTGGSDNLTIRLVVHLILRLFVVCGDVPVLRSGLVEGVHGEYEGSIFSKIKTLRETEKSAEVCEWLDLVIAEIQPAMELRVPDPVASKSHAKNILQQRLISKLSKKQSVFLKSAREVPPTDVLESAATSCVVCLQDQGPMGQLGYLSVTQFPAFGPLAAISRSRVIPRTCTHHMHYSCWVAYGSKSTGRSFCVCPYCGRPANVLLGVAESEAATDRLLATLFGENTALVNGVTLVSDWVDQMALSLVRPSEDTDLPSLISSIPLLIASVSQKLNRMQNIDAKRIFKNSNFLQHQVWAETVVVTSELVLGDFDISVAQTIRSLTQYFKPNEEWTHIAKLALLPSLYRMHVVLKYLLSWDAKKFSFQNLLEKNSTLETEWDCLIAHLPGDPDQYNEILRRAMRGVGSEASLVNVTAASAPLSIIRIPTNMDESLFDSFVGREKFSFLSHKEFRFVLSSPCLLSALPPVYQKMYTANLHKICGTCGSVPEMPVLCLLCGQLLCCGSKCCQTNDSQGEVSHHFSNRCAPNGFGAIIQLSNSLVYVVAENGKFAASWGSLYLDSHGEEDFALSRPLQLSAARVARLRSEIAENSFAWKASAKSLVWKPVGLL